MECNNSVFNDKNVFQTDGTAQGPHMSCSCSDTAMTDFDCKAENSHSQGNASEMTFSLSGHITLTLCQLS